LTAMRDNGHEPCVVIETSPGHLQAWVWVSRRPLPPNVATPVSRHLARLYQADRASADWRHVGRLAGFTNQKPQRRLPNGLSPLGETPTRVYSPGLQQPLLVGGCQAWIDAAPHAVPCLAKSADLSAYGPPF
jgi:hypothetical protein